MALTKVSTDGVKDDAITSGKIPANAVGASELADNAVDTNAIANNAVTAGKTSGVQTTINNNADNRVITGSGTANTLNGESSVVIDANGKLGVGNTNPADFDAYADRLVVGTTSGNNGMTIVAGSSNSSSIYFADGTSGGSQKNAGIVDYNHSTDNMRFATAASDAMVIDSSGRVGIQGTPNSSNFGAKLQVRESGQSATTITALFGANENASGTTGGISDNTNKACRIGLPHYDTDQKAANMFVGYAGSGVNELYIGGGTGVMNGMTSVRIYADSSSSVNNGGNQVARFDSDGLKFGTDTAAANALDDYEEGTWTPTIRGTNGTGTGGGSNYGYYTKIGNVVHAHATVHWTNMSGTTATVTQILGLPYATKNATNYRSSQMLCGQLVGVHNGADNGMNIGLTVDGNQSYAYVIGINGSSTSGYNYTHTPTILNSGIIFGFSLTYLT
jgi:hypothetical protein|tara:strand:- start:571 stop:1911 length:1341 start_codon:yes stop_codon:yes gene_type:complete